jgi:hypothetical protein
VSPQKGAFSPDPPAVALSVSANRKVKENRFQEKSEFIVFVHVREYLKKFEAKLYLS